MKKLIRVTPKQNEYLRELANGQKTTRDLVLHFMVTATSVAKTLTRLRNAGLVRSTQRHGRGNAHVHELTTPYSELNIVVMPGRGGVPTPVPDIEVIYVAKLRNPLYNERGEMSRPGLTGQDLIAAHQQK